MKGGIKMDLNLLAELLLPGIDKSPDYYIKKYPARDLSSGSLVTRYAPSPTGYQHLGGIYTALISERLAHQSGGIFYLRIEDTDKKREVPGAIENTISTLKSFNICFDEGIISSISEKGLYGPYKQSSRIEIYQAFVKDLIIRGFAYPCFCTEEELDAVRSIQQASKVRTGYYGKWSKCRNLSFDQIKSNISEGKPFVIRLKSPGNPDKKIACSDLVKGNISMPENDIDIVLLKSDGLPTYHFAHAIDDFLMKTTDVIRGEEWFPSLPLHLQLFDILGFNAPRYAHIPTIMKMDGTSKRKLSKRKDPEMSIGYYDSEGYPFEAVTEYLMNLINSDFEDWRRNNPEEPYTKFSIRLNKMSSSGALFDITKLGDVSRNTIANMNSSKVYDEYASWCRKYNPGIYELITGQPEYSRNIFNIERDSASPRKDIGKWSDVEEQIDYFYDDIFSKKVSEGYKFPGKISHEEAERILGAYRNVYNHYDDKNTWFAKMKMLAESLGYSKDMKSYKKNPEKYKGNIADVACVIRVALTNKQNTPDLYEIMQVMGMERVISRLSLKL